jgi:transcriptional regulator with XRE-family HTH domain
LPDFFGQTRNKKGVIGVDRIKAKAMRYFLNESMAEFGRRIGVGATTISDIENGHRAISDYVRAKLVRLEMQMPDDFYDFYALFKNR